MIFSLAWSISLARAAIFTPEQCVIAYVDHARHAGQLARALNFGGTVMQLGATTAGSSSGIGSVASSAGVLGGSSLGSTADRESAHAQFTSNVAQSVAESRGRVAGPFSTRLASDLNDALYGWGRFGTSSNPLGADVRANLRTALADRRLTAEDVSRATARLLGTGDLCDARGEPLSQEAWASVIVGQVTGAVVY